MEILCYNCGKPIKKSEMTKEHIPAQCFFVGYGNEYKLNRITVPAHASCNHYYSKFDQELRDAIGFMTNNLTKNPEFTKKSLNSILKTKDGVGRIYSENKEKFIDFNYGILRELHIKNFKGIFYKKFKIPIPERYKIEIISEGDQHLFSPEQMSDLFNQINQNYPNWEVSGHPDVFKYKIAAFHKDSFCDFNIGSFEQTILTVMVYNDEIMCFVFAATELSINKII